MIRKSSLLVFFLFVLTSKDYAQLVTLTPLFQHDEPLTVKLRISMKEIRNNTNDSTYVPAMMYYQNTGQQWDSIAITIRARGNFRRENCYFVPMRVKIRKLAAKGTLFEGNKSLKLVLPCQTAKSNNSLIVKEFMCYQIYKPASPYIFNTRLLNITLEEVTGRNVKVHQLFGFFIEDDDVAAERYQGKEVQVKDLHPMFLHDTSSIRHDLFEYMIANTDWSTTFFHNMKVIRTAKCGYIPIPYDFDMSGFVNAPYAKTNEELGLNSVRQRMYRGFCRNETLIQFVRKEYLDNEVNINNIISRYQHYFEAREFAALQNYLNDFYAILKNDKKFNENILQKCRTK